MQFIQNECSVPRFLGFTGYYRRFVPDYSTVAQPLVHLLGKDCKFEWTTACQDPFKALHALLITAPVLAFPKEDLPYIIDTDASDYGIGGMLSQDVDGTEYVIAYHSKSLNSAQQKYCPQCDRGSCIPISTTHQRDPEQPYTYSGGGSSMDSEFIPLESGELCVAAIATALSDNSKQIVAAQKNDKDITTVRNWISSDSFQNVYKTSRLQVTN